MGRVASEGSFLCHTRLCWGSAGRQTPVLYPPILPRPPQEIALTSGPPGGGLWSCSPNALPLPAATSEPEHLCPARSSPPLASRLGPSRHPPHDIFDLVPNLPQAGPTPHPCFLPEDAPWVGAAFLWKAISPAPALLRGSSMCTDVASSPPTSAQPLTSLLPRLWLRAGQLPRWCLWDLRPRQAWEAEGAMAAGEKHLACREELVPGDGRQVEAQRTWLSALGSPGLSTVRPCKSQPVATAPGRTAPGGERALAWGHVLRLRSKSNCFCQQWCVAPCTSLPTL